MSADPACVIPKQFAGIDLEWADDLKQEYMNANQWRRETVLARRLKEIIGNPRDMEIVRAFPNNMLATCSTYLSGVIVMVREYLRGKYPYSHKTRNIGLKLHWISQHRDTIQSTDWIDICEIAEDWYREVRQAKSEKPDYRSASLLRVSHIRKFYHEQCCARLCKREVTIVN